MYKKRWATKNELSMIAEYWFEMSCEVGKNDGIPAPHIDRIKEVKSLFLKEYESNKLIFRVATEENGNIVACAGGLMRMEYPYPLSDEQTPFGWVISIYTLPQHRKQGLATQLVDEICLWLKEQGAKKARLWASSQGKRVYESIGFTTMLDMEKVL